VPVNVDEYQNEMVNRLDLAFRSNNVTKSWRPFAGYSRRFYQPYVDIAVGPFAVKRQCIEEYDSLVITNGALIDKWITSFQNNWKEVIGRRYWAVSPATPKKHDDFISLDSNQQPSGCLNYPLFPGVKRPTLVDDRHQDS
jgi:hypothetical protein